MPIPADAAEIAVKTFRSLESGFMRTEAGTDLANLFKNKYIPMYHSLLEQGTKTASTLPMHMQPAPHEISEIARNEARLKTLGQNDYRAIGLVKAVQNDPKLAGNPLAIHMEQQNLADHIHMFLKDTVETKRGPQSQFKMNLQRGKEGLKQINSGAKYSPATDTERWMIRAASKPMLAGIAIPHIGTLLSFALTTNLTDLAKGVYQATLENKSVRNMVADHGIFAGTVADAYATRYYGSRGIIVKTTGNSTFGSVVAQLTHQPGFHTLREWTLSIGAATGKLQTERFARDLIASKGTDKVALYNLKKMGIDTQTLLAQGQLTPDMLRTGIFNYVDQKVFLDNTMARSFNSQRNAFMRFAGMYHGYISRQGSMLYNTLRHDLPNDPAKIAQAFGVLAVAFPTVGVGIKSMQAWSRGQSSDLIADEKKLYGKDGVSEAFKEAIEGYSHMAAFGVANDYMRSTFRHQLIQQIAGPIGNEVANLAQDTVGAFYHFDSDDPNKSFEPIERDVLADTLPDNIGKILAHKLLPTKSEEKAAKGSTKFKKFKGAKFKKLSSIN